MARRTRPGVSIIVPCFDREAYLAEALDSILAQTVADWEAIVVDDGSSDLSADIARTYAERDPRIRLIRQANNGSAAARNAGIREADARWLMFLDADDFYEPDAVETLTEAARHQPREVKLLYGDYLLWREAAGEAPIQLPMAEPWPKPYLFLQFLLGNPIQTGSVIAERKAVLDVGLFDETLRHAQDFNLWVRMALAHDVVKVRAATYTYRIHADAQNHKARGEMRLSHDRTCRHLLSALPLDQLFPRAETARELADSMERTAELMLGAEFAAVDTALQLCDTAGVLAPTADRAERLQAFEARIDRLMAEKFADGPRLPRVPAPPPPELPRTAPRPSPKITAAGRPGASFAAAVVIPTILRPSLLKAVRSIFAQTLASPIQILIGVDRGRDGDGLLETLGAECPANRHLTVIDPGYSTSERHGGLHPAWDGGSLRTALSYLANSRYVAYLDDDVWWHPEHLARLLDAIEGKEWAFSLRWFVAPEDGARLAVDRWESVGPSAGVYHARYGGFSDPNTLMIDKLACEQVLRCWSKPLPDSATRMDADRNVFAALVKRGRYGRSNRATAYYPLNPQDVQHSRRLAWIKGASAPGKRNK